MQNTHTTSYSNISPPHTLAHAIARVGGDIMAIEWTHVWKHFCIYSSSPSLREIGTTQRSANTHTQKKALEFISTKVVCDMCVITLSYTILYGFFTAPTHTHRQTRRENVSPTYEYGIVCTYKHRGIKHTYRADTHANIDIHAHIHLRTFCPRCRRQIHPLLLCVTQRKERREVATSATRLGHTQRSCGIKLSHARGGVQHPQFMCERANHHSSEGCEKCVRAK